MFMAVFFNTYLYGIFVIRYGFVEIVCNAVYDVFDIDFMFATGCAVYMLFNAYRVSMSSVGVDYAIIYVWRANAYGDFV